MFMLDSSLAQRPGQQLGLRVDPRSWRVRKCTKERAVLRMQKWQEGKQNVGDTNTMCSVTRQKSQKKMR